MAANSRFAVATHILTLMAHSEKTRDGLLSSEWIAGSVNTNPVVIRRLLSQLGKAGLVSSLAGKGGGVRLARTPERISLLDVYRAVGESDVFALNGAKPNPKCPVSCRMANVLKPVFSDLQDGMQARLGKMKLSELVGKIG